LELAEILAQIGKRMKKYFWKKIAKSTARIVTALAIILGISALCYWGWQPGSDEPLPQYTNNAVWIGHGWLGDNGWFERNKRKKADFRSKEKISALFKKLSNCKIKTVYPHLCPAQMNGKIAACDNEQFARFLDLAEQYNIKVLPWVGGVLYESARPGDKEWRKNFASSVDALLKQHPRVAGIHLNIEPWPHDNADFLRLLDEIRMVTQGKILSVAAYPPPTKWHRFPDVHWPLYYIHRLTRHCDQLVVMMYDTAIPLEKFYIKLMSDWTKQLTGAIRSTGCELLLGIPAYDDAGVGYHHPQVENINSALQGISASPRKNAINGIAIYCEWEMDESKWQLWRKFIR
jgi:hypothetical protein